MSIEETPPLTEFRARYAADDNEWWVLDSGHHMNLFDEACEQIDELLARIEKAKELHFARGRNILGYPVCDACSPLKPWPCPTYLALSGDETERGQ